MPAVTLNGSAVPIRMWASPHEVDSRTIAQLKAVASLPWVVGHVAVMPDVHAGRGATVGSVIAMRGAIAPAAVGVDIGCGMTAVRTNLTAGQLPDDLRRVRLALERVVPVGRAQHREPVWSEASTPLAARIRALFARFAELTAPVQHLPGRAAYQIGSLGARALRRADLVSSQLRRRRTTLR